MRLLLAVALCLCVLALEATAQIECTNRQAREACAMALCQKCIMLDGKATCSAEFPLSGNTCVSPCLDPAVTTISPSVNTAPCAYYEMLHTPFEEVLVPKCANVESEMACDILGGVFQHSLGPFGMECGPMPFMGEVVDGVPCCPDGMIPALLDDGTTPLCIVNSTAYEGPFLFAHASGCNETSICTSVPVSMVAGEGLIGGNATCPGCTIPGETCGTCEPRNCFQYAVPPASISAPSLGVCQGGLCFGTLNSMIATSSESCDAGFCRARVKDDVNLEDPDNYPTLTCHPGCPGYPTCPSDCPGWTNPDDVIQLLEPVVSEADLEEGDNCLLADACADNGVCVSGTCTPRRSKGPWCERLTCYECSPSNGTCTHLPSPAGTPCRAGCIVDSLGTCDGNGNCIGTPDDDAQCAIARESVVSANTGSEVCADTTCTPVQTLFDDPNVNIPFVKLNDIPLTPAVLASQALIDLLDEGIQAYIGFLSECSFAPNTNLCDDGDACTTGDVCSSYECVPQLDNRRYCQFVECSTCNTTTGACNDDVFLSAQCFSGCGQGDQLGQCSAFGRCEPYVLRDTGCPTPGPCDNVVCTPDFIPGSPIPIPIDASPTLGDFSSRLDFDCVLTDAEENQSCTTDPTNLCVYDERCMSGVCEVVGQVSCNFVDTSRPCFNSSLTECNPATGACDPVPLDDGDECSLNNACFTNATCVVSGMSADCVGVPSLDCSPIPLNNPCVISSFCVDNNGTPECATINELDMTPCTLTNFGNCGAGGVCLNGMCQAQSANCPDDGNPCTVSVCDVSTGNCTTMPIQDGTDCTDGLMCTQNDVCMSGVCTGTLRDCNAEAGECQVSTGCTESELCTFANAPMGTECDDGFGVCDEGVCLPVCDPPCENNGICVGANPVVCACTAEFTGQFCESTVEEETETFAMMASEIQDNVITYAIFLSVAAAIVSALVTTLVMMFGRKRAGVIIAEVEVRKKDQ